MGAGGCESPTVDAPRGEVGGVRDSPVDVVGGGGTIRDGGTDHERGVAGGRVVSGVAGFRGVNRGIETSHPMPSACWISWLTRSEMIFDWSELRFSCSFLRRSNSLSKTSISFWWFD